MPKLRAAMHLDTVFTFADRDCATAYLDIVDGIHAFSLRPADSVNGTAGIQVTEERKPFTDVVAAALGIGKLRIVETGGDVYATERQQRDSGNNLVALEPGVVLVGGGGCSVMDVASAEELHEYTALCPIGCYLSFDIKPLIELDASFSMGREHLPD